MRGDAKQKRPEHATSELACTRCRERKVRCGRERPQCRNCERDNAVCIFQSPVKRVNHIKLLCDTVEQVQDRLLNMESHLERLTGNMDRTLDQEDHSSNQSSRQASLGHHDFDDNDDDDDNNNENDDDNMSESPSSLLTVKSTGTHIFRSRVDMVDRYYGPSSLFGLCNGFRLRASAASGMIEPSDSLEEMLESICKIAGTTEHFPAYSDQSLNDLLPKQQTLAAVDKFFQHVDSSTDLFVQSSLLSNLERVYSQPMKSRDETWAICLKTIILLVLGNEMSTQANNALFGDFALSFLPSRAALVNSRLLTVPRLINVQTLILLSIAAQRFDPHGWAELLFAHACMLAKTMGVHHVHISPPDTSADERLERAKVLRSLYSRDKSLCTVRGSVCWLPSDDCNITSQLNASVEQQISFSARLRLSLIQDDIHRLIIMESQHRPNSSSKPKVSLQRIEHQLDQYARASGVLDSDATCSPRRAYLALEYLATRILALQTSSEFKHLKQVHSDATASCSLLLIALGDQDRQLVDVFRSCTQSDSSALCRNGSFPVSEESTPPFASVLDAFSLSAYFVLLDGIIRSVKNNGASESSADLDLLRKVVTCYNIRTGQMQANSYHRKVALVFNQLLSVIDLFKQASSLPKQGVAPQPPPAVEKLPTNPGITSFQTQVPEFSGTPATLLHGDLSHLTFQPTTSTGVPLSWDSWLNAPSSLGPAIGATTPSVVGSSTIAGIDSTPSNRTLFGQMLGSSFPDALLQSKQWPDVGLETSAAPKRRRTNDDIEFS